MSRRPFFEDETLTLWHGDALDVLAGLGSGSVDCIVTSPPYYGLRDYGTAGQYGLEATPAAYVDTMRALFAEGRRVLADDGTLWLNLGDSYSSRRGGTQGAGGARADRAFTAAGLGGAPDGVPDKNLLGMPWRVAFALQEDGWILRNAVIWHKPNAMPESVTDRLSCRYEHVFLFSKSRRYWFDLDPIREPLAYPDAADGSRVFGGRNKAGELQTGSSTRRTGAAYGRPDPTPYPDGMAGQAYRAADGTRHGSRGQETGRNPGDVWSMSTQPFAGAHFAVMPRELARRAVLAGCRPGGTVLDPFSGSGTTGLVAQENGRRYVGVDLSADYLRLSLETRLRARPFDFGGLA